MSKWNKDRARKRQKRGEITNLKGGKNNHVYSLVTVLFLIHEGGFLNLKKKKKSALIYLCSLHLWLFPGQIRTTQTGFYIGAGTGGQNFKGYIDEVRSMGGLLDHYILSFECTWPDKSDFFVALWNNKNKIDMRERTILISLLSK